LSRALSTQGPRSSFVRPDQDCYVIQDASDTGADVLFYQAVELSRVLVAAGVGDPSLIRLCIAPEGGDQHLAGAIARDVQGSPQTSVLTASTLQDSGAAVVVDHGGYISVLWSEVENAADYWLSLVRAP
jgi:hypothetical protein